MDPSRAAAPGRSAARRTGFPYPGIYPGGRAGLHHRRSAAFPSPRSTLEDAQGSFTCTQPASLTPGPPLKDTQGRFICTQPGCLTPGRPLEDAQGSFTCTQPGSLTLGPLLEDAQSCINCAWLASLTPGPPWRRTCRAASPASGQRPLLLVNYGGHVGQLHLRFSLCKKAAWSLVSLGPCLDRCAPSD